MGHDWLFEVLGDMRAYAERHGMQELAQQIETTEAVARREVAAQNPDGDDLSRKPARRG